MTAYRLNFIHPHTYIYVYENTEPDERPLTDCRQAIYRPDSPKNINYLVLIIRSYCPEPIS
jgi:hypothetical protein